MRGRARSGSPGDWFGVAATETAERLLAVLDGEAKTEHGALPRHLVIAVHRFALEKVDRRLVELSALSLDSESAKQGYSVLGSDDHLESARPGNKTDSDGSPRIKRRGKSRKAKSTGTGPESPSGESSPNLSGADSSPSEAEAGASLDLLERE